MFAFFDFIATAFLIARVLYELTQYLGAHWWRINTSSKVFWNPQLQRVEIMKNAAPRTPAIAAQMIWARYTRRSLVLHQLNAIQFPDVQPEFSTWP